MEKRAKPATKKPATKDKKVSQVPKLMVLLPPPLLLLRLLRQLLVRLQVPLARRANTPSVTPYRQAAPQPWQKVSLLVQPFQVRRLVVRLPPVLLQQMVTKLLRTLPTRLVVWLTLQLLQRRVLL